MLSGSVQWLNATEADFQSSLKYIEIFPDLHGASTLSYVDLT